MNRLLPKRTIENGWAIEDAVPMLGLGLGSHAFRDGNQFGDGYPRFLAIAGRHNRQAIFDSIDRTAASIIDFADHADTGPDAFAGAVEARCTKRRPFRRRCGGSSPAREAFARPGDQFGCHRHSPLRLVVARLYTLSIHLNSFKCNTIFRKSGK